MLLVRIILGGVGGRRVSRFGRVLWGLWGLDVKSRMLKVCGLMGTFCWYEGNNESERNRNKRVFVD